MKIDNSTFLITTTYYKPRKAGGVFPVVEKTTHDIFYPRTQEILERRLESLERKILDDPHPGPVEAEVHKVVIGKVGWYFKNNKKHEEATHETA